MKDPATSWREFNETLQALKKKAIEEDPGLPEALDRARRIDPDVGWLDVAAHREKQREVEAT